MAEVTATFSAPLKGPRRKKCRICGNLINIGEDAVFEKWLTEKYYPVKGVMGFTKWVAKHASCVEN